MTIDLQRRALLKVTVASTMLAVMPGSVLAQKSLAASSDEQPTLSTPESQDGTNASAWEALRSNRAVALIRHALAPGYSDPAGFVLDRCETQRNLSDTGRRQAVRLGDALRERGIPEARVYSSQWCRCLETARLMDLGPVRPFEGINSFFETRSMRAARTRETLAFIDEALEDADATPLVLVTHQVNISALTGTFADSGDLLIATPDQGSMRVLYRFDAY